MSQLAVVLGFVFVVVFAGHAQACQPNATHDEVEKMPELPTRTKRAVEGSVVLATIVTNRPFDESANEANLNVIKTQVLGFASSQGIRFPDDKVKLSARNSGGKLAIRTEIASDVASCERVFRFAQEARASIPDIQYVVVDCGDHKMRVA